MEGRGLRVVVVLLEMFQDQPLVVILLLLLSLLHLLLILFLVQLLLLAVGHLGLVARQQLVQGSLLIDRRET